MFLKLVVYGLKIYMADQIKHLIIFGSRAEFLSFGTIDILGQVILVVGAVLNSVGCLVVNLASTV